MEHNARIPLPIMFWLSAILGTGWLGYASLHYFIAGDSSSGFKALVSTCIFAILSPITWSISDWLRRYAAPSIYFGTGFFDMIGKRFFWTYGPQLIALGGLAFLMLSFVGNYKVSSKAGALTMHPSASNSVALQPTANQQPPETTTDAESASTESFPTTPTTQEINIAKEKEAKREIDAQKAFEETKRQKDQEELDKNTTQEIIDEENKRNQASAWSADWGNEIQALITTKECTDAEFLQQGYNYNVYSSIPLSRLKNPTDSWFVSKDRATTVTGCWFKKEDGLWHLKMRRKKDNKIFECDININDGSWTKNDQQGEVAGP